MEIESDLGTASALSSTPLTPSKATSKSAVAVTVPKKSANRSSKEPPIIAMDITSTTNFNHPISSSNAINETTLNPDATRPINHPPYESEISAVIAMFIQYHVDRRTKPTKNGR